MTDKRDAWLTSDKLVAELTAHRPNDVKIDVCGILAPVSGAYYDHLADAIIVELAEGGDKDTLQDAIDLYDRTPSDG